MVSFSFLKTKICRASTSTFHAVSIDLVDQGVPFNVYLICSRFSIYHECILCSKNFEGFRNSFSKCFIRDTDNLPARSRRIGQGTKKVEYRSYPKLWSQWSCEFHSGVKCLGEHESYAGFCEAVFHFFRTERYINAECFEYICATGRTRHCSISVLCNINPCTCDNKCGRC